MPSHYLNQCWNIVNWTLGNKHQWNFNRNSNIFIEENTFENVVCEMLFISSRPQCVKTRRYPPPIRRQAIIWTNPKILLIGPLETNFSEIAIEIYTFSFKKRHLKCSVENGLHFVSAPVFEMVIHQDNPMAAPNLRTLDYSISRDISLVSQCYVFHFPLSWDISLVSQCLYFPLPFILGYKLSLPMFMFVITLYHGM